MHGRLLSFQPNFQLNVKNVFSLTLGRGNGAFQGHFISKMKYSFIGKDSLTGSLSEMWIPADISSIFDGPSKFCV